MAKIANINVKLEAGLKKEVDAIFKSLGISTTDAVQLFFKKVRDFKGLPFNDDIPNEETMQVMRDTDAGKNLTEWESVDSYFNYIEDNVKAENHS
ncbi:MAG: type II toxin-antitoxin system RelB/DinJ family antitoxin [Candidatus Aminicenantes bacterium]|nr:type II toxin-antitoxin system RelB/DinJ family antitoxin [Candidatus Aminicenantes bacterium]